MFLFSGHFLRNDQVCFFVSVRNEGTSLWFFHQLMLPGPGSWFPGPGPGLTCVVAQRDTQGRVQQGASLSVTLRRRGSDPSTGEDTSRQKDMLSWLPAGRRTRTLTHASATKTNAPRQLWPTSSGLLCTGDGQVPQRNVVQLFGQTGHPVRVRSERDPFSVLHLPPLLPCLTVKQRLASVSS